jgi:hypothetical protein
VVEAVSLNLRILFPVLQVVSDFSKAMIKDDQKDLAFPTRYHKGMIHHYQVGLITFPFAELAMKLIDVYEIVKTEPFRKTDTPGTFLQRVVAIHKKTYVPPQEDEDRVELLSQYFNQLRNEPTKKDIKHKIEKAIYMGKIKTKSQLEAELRRRKSRHPPRMPPRPSQGKIMLFKK